MVRLDIDKMQWVNPDNPEELLEYLEMLVNQDLSLYELNEDEQQGYKQSWTRALIDKLRNVRSQHLTETNAV